MDRDESEALLRAMFDIAEDPAIIYEHEWRVGDLVVWDNLACLHARTDWPRSSAGPCAAAPRRRAVVLDRDLSQLRRTRLSSPRIVPALQADVESDSTSLPEQSFRVTPHCAGMSERVPCAAAFGRRSSVVASGRQSAGTIGRLFDVHEDSACRHGRRRPCRLPAVAARYASPPDPGSGRRTAARNPTSSRSKKKKAKKGKNAKKATTAMKTSE